MDARAKWIKWLAVVTLILTVLLIVAPWVIVTAPKAIQSDPKSTGDSGPAEFGAMMLVMAFFGMFEVVVAIGNWFLLRLVLDLNWRPIWLTQFLLPILSILIVCALPFGFALVLLFNITASISVFVLPVKPKQLVPRGIQ